MRLSEKSFEVRFCAALTSMLMPFCPNPQWFGLTQAQERKAGIDTILKLGKGRVFVFQFKAAHSKKSNPTTIKFDIEQCEILGRFTHRHGFVFYIVPNVATVNAVGSKLNCILKESYWIDASDLKSSLTPSANKSAQGRISPETKYLLFKNFDDVPAFKTCELIQACTISNSFRTSNRDRSMHLATDLSFNENLSFLEGGIESEEFVNIFSEFKTKRLPPNLTALYLPSHNN